VCVPPPVAGGIHVAVLLLRCCSFCCVCLLRLDGCLAPLGPPTPIQRGSPHAPACQPGPSRLTPPHPHPHPWQVKVKVRPLALGRPHRLGLPYGGLCGMPACGQAVGCGVCDTPEAWRRGPVCARVRACAAGCWCRAESVYVYIHTYTYTPLITTPPTHTHTVYTHTTHIPDPAHRTPTHTHQTANSKQKQHTAYPYPPNPQQSPLIMIMTCS